MSAILGTIIALMSVIAVAALLRAVVRRRRSGDSSEAGIGGQRHGEAAKHLKALRPKVDRTGRRAGNSDYGTDASGAD